MGLPEMHHESVTLFLAASLMSAPAMAQAGAEERHTTSILKGAKDKWGKIPMPA
jgi:cytochrome c551/c552